MKTVVLLSGGMDSCVLLAHQLRKGDECIGLAVDYGQRHLKELVAAHAVAEALDVELVVADLSAAASIFAGSSQTSEEIAVPHGHYTDASMAATVVPNRNLLLLALAGVLAVSRGGLRVAYAAHAGDHPVYADCRPEFADAASQALYLGAGVTLLRPFIDVDKAAIVVRGHGLDAPLHLTWSCYEGGARHCGRCGTCRERREAFQLAGVGDPTEWAE